MKKTITILLATIGIMSCGNNQEIAPTENEQNSVQMTGKDRQEALVGKEGNMILEELKGRDVVLFVADEDEISQADVPFPVVYTGMGKMRMFSALVKWYETRADGGSPVILNIGSAGSAKYPIGTILNCSHFVNGGSELIYDQIDVPGDGCSVFSGDYFMSTQTFSPEQVKALSTQYDLFDMEAYAAAQFCKMHGIPFYCLKAVSDNMDGSLKDWRSILLEIRSHFTSLLKNLAG